MSTRRYLLDAERRKVISEITFLLSASRRYLLALI